MAYATNYRNSHAIVIGINEYKIKPLRNCVSDAEAVASRLEIQFKFARSNILLLRNKEATEAGIREAHQRFILPDVSIDDRLLFFFAGHGETIDGHNERAGFIIPYDGELDRRKWISWRSLTEYQDLLKPKHILYIVDACFGGTFFDEVRSVGNSVPTDRFIEDMTTRLGRQGITGGQKDQVVSDGGGPLPNHSIFTGHLLRGLDGEAVLDEPRSLITGTSLGHQVKRDVGLDRRSQQTPDFGFIKGSGDFVFNALEPLRVPEAEIAQPVGPTIMVQMAQGIPDDFIRSEPALSIFVKDGRGFFEARIGILRERFLDKSKQTRIVIAHPKSPHLAAIASMDAKKRLDPALQLHDCLATIKILQTTLESLSNGDPGIRSRTAFRGCQIIPTWAGFIGESGGYISLYFSRPFRGLLNTVRYKSDEHRNYHRAMNDDFDCIFDDYCSDPTDDLWNFKLPDPES